MELVLGVLGFSTGWLLVDSYLKAKHIKKMQAQLKAHEQSINNMVVMLAVESVKIEKPSE